MKKSLVFILAIGLVLIGSGAVATAAGSAAVTFTVQPTQELTASALALGAVTAGTNNKGDRNPVTVSSNTAWKVTAQADGDFTALTNTIAANNLSLGGNALSTTSSVQIANGAAGQSLSPNVATVLTVPWSVDPSVGSDFSGSVTYAVLPN